MYPASVRLHPGESLSLQASARRPRRGISGVVLLAAAMVASATAQIAQATWSIVMVDTETKEVGVASATCLTGLDLQELVPVVIVDVGGAAAQSLGDGSGVNRMTIWNEMMAGTHPEDILAILEDNDSSHQQRQYGMVDVRGRNLTFTGTGAGGWAGGVIGQAGNIVYAIQGNVLTGEPVVTECEAALVNTPGDLPEKLMAAMQAARAMGGDGRCSCGIVDPEGCGVPPPDFEKSAHIGFMVITRAGDVDGVCTGADGCANGDYFMSLDVANASGDDPDPVEQLQGLFDAWRADLIGRPDAVQSSSALTVDAFPADGTGTTTLSFTLRDWQGTIYDNPGATVTVTHAPDSDGTTTIGPLVNDGGGSFHVDLTGSAEVGIDRIHVTVDDGIRPVILLPLPQIISHSLADFDVDGDVDRADHAELVSCLTGPAVPPDPLCQPTDTDNDADVDLVDYARLQQQYTDGPCDTLRITGQPTFQVAPCGTPFTVSVTADADPEAIYQWYHDGVLIPGANGPSYTDPSAENADFGYYWAEISNTCGTVVSNQALVRIFPACP